MKPVCEQVEVDVEAVTKSVVMHVQRLVRLRAVEAGARHLATLAEIDAATWGAEFPGKSDDRRHDVPEVHEYALSLASAQVTLAVGTVHSGIGVLYEALARARCSRDQVIAGVREAGLWDGALDRFPAEAAACA